MVTNVKDTKSNETEQMIMILRRGDICIDIRQQQPGQIIDWEEMLKEVIQDWKSRVTLPKTSVKLNYCFTAKCPVPYLGDLEVTSFEDLETYIYQLIKLAKGARIDLQSENYRRSYIIVRK